MDRWTKLEGDLEVYPLDLEAPDGLENPLRHAQKSLREGRGVVVLRTRTPLPSHDFVVRLSQRELPPALPGARARESVSGGDCAHHRAAAAGSGDLGGHHAEAAGGGLLLFFWLRTKPCAVVTLVTFARVREVASLFCFLSGAATLGGWREAGAEGEEWIARIPC